MPGCQGQMSLSWPASCRRTRRWGSRYCRAGFGLWRSGLAEEAPYVAVVTTPSEDIWTIIVFDLTSGLGLVGEDGSVSENESVAVFEVCARVFSSEQRAKLGYWRLDRALGQLRQNTSATRFALSTSETARYVAVLRHFSPDLPALPELPWLEGEPVSLPEHAALALVKRRAQVILPGRQTQRFSAGRAVKRTASCPCGSGVPVGWCQHEQG